MSKKRKSKPNHIEVNGQSHTLIIFEITGKFPNGTPRHCTRIAEEGTTRVDTPVPKEFMSAYIPTHMLRDRKQ